MDDAAAFLDAFFKELTTYPIEVQNLQLDHIAYQSGTKENYEFLIPEFLNLGEQIREVMIKDRRVGVFRLYSPIKYNHYEIEAAELIEPVEGKRTNTGWEHAEFVLQESFESFMQKYPNLQWDISSIDRPKYAHLKLRLSENMQVKFHLHSILTS